MHNTFPITLRGLDEGNWLAFDFNPRQLELKPGAVELIDLTVTPKEGGRIGREGTDFGRANNVEIRVLLAAGEQTSVLSFRLDQLEAADDTGQELVLRFEERDGIAKLARCTSTGLDVELHHILTFT